MPLPREVQVQVLVDMFQIFWPILEFINGVVLASVIMRRCCLQRLLNNCLSEQVLKMLDSGVRSRELNATTILLRANQMLVLLKMRNLLASRLEELVSINMYIGPLTLLWIPGNNFQTSFPLIFKLQEKSRSTSQEI